jgi:hypothetical protein
MLMLYLHILPDAEKKKKKECMCSVSDILTSPTCEEEKLHRQKFTKLNLMNTKKKEKRNRTIRNNDVILVLLPVLLMTLTSLSFLMDTIKLIYVQQRRRNTKLNIMTVRLLTIGHYVYNNDNN